MKMRSWGSQGLNLAVVSKKYIFTLVLTNMTMWLKDVVDYSTLIFGIEALLQVKL